MFGKPPRRPIKIVHGWRRVGYMSVTAEMKKDKVSFDAVIRCNLESYKLTEIIKKMIELEDLLEKESIANRNSKFTRKKAYE